ncbi:GFA family protein [Sphingomonas psychrotolerans]|uniref:Aldehyde-activating protein n=1 Tax=Sphingomonas psychrotolerans TaxID=1327635 RepID=A0A2K8MHU4_9SPHN|nr:GFA family protein [Sphingomonas psychrotolerans]ATY31329.1 aldehyde-activating protein [Sphingomonas psychrotolerans]
MSRYTGRCACGAVTAAIAGDAIQVRQCWCRQCQQIAAGSPTTNAMFATDDLTIHGDLTETSYVAASGNTLTQSFCGKCGTQVMGRSSARPQFRTLRLGFLDVPNDLAPQVAIWTEDAPAWAVIDPKLEVFPRQPPPPPTA